MLMRSCLRKEKDGRDLGVQGEEGGWDDAIFTAQGIKNVNIHGVFCYPLATKETTVRRLVGLEGGQLCFDLALDPNYNVGS